MKIRIPPRYRARLSTAYLDWVEMLPKFGGGPIHILQLIRESQRRQSEDTYQRTRPPEGVKVQYLYFRLVELFQIEDFDQLRKLFALFSKPEDDSGSKSLAQQLSERAQRISGGSWWNLGVLSKDGRGFRQATKKPADLPEEVKQIDVWAFQLLPSIFVVTFDARLNEMATSKLSQLRDRHYLPEIVFAQLIPRDFIGRSGNMADDVMAREIYDWLEQLRGKVEACLRPLANGYFMQHSPGKVARLPAFEVFAFKGIGEMKNGSSRWLQESTMWLRSLGINAGLFTYTNNEVVVVPSDNSIWWDESRKPPHRLIILWEPFVKAKSKNGNNIDDNGAVYETQFLLSGILPLFIIPEFLDFVQARIEDLRQRVFHSVNSGWFARIGLGAQIGLNDKILQESFLLDRLSTEFKQQEGVLSSYMEQFTEDAANLKRLATSGDGDLRSLRDDLRETIKCRIALLTENLTLIKDWFSQYSALRITAATGRLNSILVLLTFILVILTVALVWLTKNLASPH